jgi:hypothetical protein
MTTLALALAVLAGPTAEWKVSPTGTLLWEGAPYVPVGLRVSGTAESVREAAAAGVKDVVVELPADGSGWGPVVAALKESGLRFWVRIVSGAPSSPYIAAEPDAYRVPGIKGRTALELSLPGARDALVVTARVRDGSVSWQGRAPVVDGVLRTTVDPNSDLDQTALVFATFDGLALPDAFEALDVHRDRLLTALKSNDLGPGLRGVIDPMGRLGGYPGPDNRFVPRSRLFQAEFAAWLERKYGSVNACLQAWRLAANDIDDFDHLARLVPLWSGGRGVSQVWDTATDRLYLADNQGSQAWKDLNGALSAVIARRYRLLAEAVRSTAGVPVLQSWTHGPGPWREAQDGLDGLAFAAPPASLPFVVDAAGGPAGLALTRSGGRLVVADGLAIGPDSPQLADLAAELEGMGVRGLFFEAKTAEERQAVARLAESRMGDSDLADWRPRVLPFPTEATDPCRTARLPGGVWWLPGDGFGERLDFGGAVRGYRYEGRPEPFVALWSEAGLLKTVLRFADPKTAQFTTADGQPVRTRVRRQEVELDLGPDPVLVYGGEVPVPKDGWAETVAIVTALIESNPQRIDPDNSERYGLGQAVQSFERSPWDAMKALRGQLGRLLAKAAPYEWMAGSEAVSHDFSGPGTVAGSASAQCLLAKARWPRLAPFRATYRARALAAGTYSVWAAGRISGPGVSTFVTVGGRRLEAQEGPVSLYGDGLAWRSYGSVELTAQPLEVVFEIAGPTVFDAAVDVVLLYPGEYSPSGPRLPTEFVRAVPTRPGG